MTALGPASLLRYAAVFVVVALGVGWAASQVSAGQAEGVAASIQLMVPAMIAALIEGGMFAKRHTRRHRFGEAWGFALATTVIATGLNLAIAYGAAGIAPEFGKLAIAPAMSQQFLTLLGIYALGYLLCNRFFFGLGVGNQLNLIARHDSDESRS
jgi:hypothetical protein